MTTAYEHNVANEYSSIEDVPGGGGAVSVYYDAAGNLSRDEGDFEYGYDHENRLTSVEYDDGAALTQVAHFEYDALGRLISSQLRYDTDTDANTETLTYYYDGQNVIAEYDPADNLSRRYVHGTTYVDERAVLLEGEGATLDTFYYLLQELYSVVGLIKKNGTLAEAYVYDGYGKAHTWGYRDFDMNRDGDVDMDDAVEAGGGGYNPDAPAVDPPVDLDCDGNQDGDDYSALAASMTDVGEPPIELYVSAVGNPYFFTGRRLHFMEDLNEEDENPNLQVQYNRNRHYQPGHGRWLQRDPQLYADGMHLYQYARSNPANLADYRGLDIVIDCAKWESEPTLRPLPDGTFMWGHLCLELDSPPHPGADCGCPITKPDINVKGCDENLTEKIMKGVTNTASMWCDLLECMNDPQHKAAIEDCFKKEKLVGGRSGHTITDARGMLCKAVKSLADGSRTIECVCCGRKRCSACNAKVSGPMHTPASGWFGGYHGQPIHICKNRDMDIMARNKMSHELLRWWIGDARAPWDNIERWDDAIGCAFNYAIGKCGSTKKKKP